MGTGRVCWGLGGCAGDWEGEGYYSCNAQITMKHK